MKNIIVFWGLICLLGVVHAQHQMTNFGNLRFHQGSSVTYFGNFSNTGAFTDTANVVTFKGSTNQIISGTSVINFNNCVISNNSGVSLQRDVAVKNSLNLTAGSLVLNSNTLLVLNGITSAIIRIAGNIVSEQTDNSGKLIWMIGNTTGPHVFPFATVSGQYIPFTLDLTSGTIGTVTLSTYPTFSTNLPYPSNPDIVTHVNNALGMDNSANTVDRFWQIEKDGLGGTATLTFTATSTEVGSIGNLGVYRWNVASQGWETPGGIQTNTSTSVTVQDVVNFSPWTLAGNGTPLPIELLSFTAKLNNDRQVDLGWTTASEVNNDFFTIEKTLNGIDFEFVGEVDGAGNSNQELNYYLLDIDPYHGQSYYRLKQTDFDGQVKYTDLRSIYISSSGEFSWSLYPNPSNGNFSVMVAGLKEKNVVLNIMDITGKLIYTEPVYVEHDQQIIPVDQLGILSAGIYTIQLIIGDQSYASNMIIH